MEHYISKSALVAGIERLKSIQLSIFSKGETEESCYKSLSCISVYNEVLSFLDTLEVKEVDLDSEITLWANVIPEIRLDDVERLATYFFELGLKARKGE